MQFFIYICASHVCIVIQTVKVIVLICVQTLLCVFETLGKTQPLLLRIIP